MILYLDENCYQRGFDDQSQVRIKMEALACQEILQKAEAGAIDLVWSFMLLDETLQCPFPERKMAVLRVSSVCKFRIGPDEAVHRSAIKIREDYGLEAKDAVHLACALAAGSDVFLTCDDDILKRVKTLEKMEILNPIDYIRKEVH